MRLGTPTRRRANDGGAVAIVVAIFVFVCMVLLAFVVDRGRAYVIQTQLQNTVDAAALAGSLELCGQGSSAEAVQAARQYAELNGVKNEIVNGASTDVLRVDTPYTVDSIEYLNVRASRPVFFFFGGFLNPGSQQGVVAAQATGGVDCRGKAGFAVYAGNILNVNGGGSNPMSTNGSVFGGGSGGGTCNNSCPVDFPNGIDKVVLIGDAFSPIDPAMKANSDFTSNGVLKHTATLDTTTSTDPVTHATDIGLVGIIDGIVADSNGPPYNTGKNVAATVTSTNCSIDLSAPAYSNAEVITCAGSGVATITGTAIDKLKLISVVGSMVIDTDVGSSGNVVIMKSTASGGSAVMPAKDITVYGTIYAPYGEVRTNGHSFQLLQGRVIAKDFLVDGNSGGFSSSTIDDPYAEKVFRLYQ